MRTDPESLKTIKEASRSFLSLVDFIKEGHDLNYRATTQACTLLEGVSPHYNSTFTSTQILFELVPTRDGSCSGFTNSMTTLLTSSNEKLVQRTLSLLNETVIETTHSNRFRLLMTGLFTHLPQSFYEQEMHLFAQNRLYLMNIVKWLLFCSRPSSAREICEERQISMDTYNHTIIHKFFHPVEPFLNFICDSRHRITEPSASIALSELLGRVFQYSAFLEEMTLFVVSSSLALTCTDCLDYHENDHLTILALQGVMDGVRAWKKEGPAVRKRGQQILAKLCEEGLSDEIELVLQCSMSDIYGSRVVFLGAQLVHNLGGNIPFLTI
ncbi:hypothetical protein BLNAU_22146 [Blattamonas nauphoetae]|uniref:Uncharacterized protein n=1 Tax=Blattamonas nauphoetae TaxID=2049346 RepID=A0ABQ9WTV8_9EUKA|nr:hypothetical protein BLNAU_22146 [Blattamonas nauphoetae]